MRLVQFVDPGGVRRVARVTDGGRLAVLDGAPSTYALAMEAARRGERLEDVVARHAITGTRTYGEAHLLPPLDHPDPAHCFVTGTGLTHIGSAQARDAMHAVQAEDEAKLSDSMKMFRLGLEGGRPEGGGVGVAPEWFYKGDGGCVVPPGVPLTMPAFALDGGEEAELALLYVIDDEGRPRRVGSALGNEFSDHITERENYLYLAHSKLRQCSFGPELLLGEPPLDVRGTVRVYRGDEMLWEGELVSGEANMSHSLANLEHHHFKYREHRRPGDVHVHFLGAAVLSFSSGVRVEPGDLFEIWADAYGEPLRNPVQRAEDEGMVRVTPL
jgi:hypothetical protein